ncbi:Nuclear transcription factor Y subunit B-6 [Linum grandiflorum]
MPIANVIRIMRRILPPHAKISDDAKETIQECVSEYISFVTGEANERCQREQRKTVTADDVLWAMGKLGFDNYVEPLSLYLARYRETEGDRAASYNMQQQQQQQQGPNNFQMHNNNIEHQGMYDASSSGGYYRDPSFGSGSGQGSGSGGEDGWGSHFDIYPQFK